MTPEQIQRLSDERLAELAPLLSCTRSGQVLDQDEQCSCVDCSWDAGIAESCLALLDEVRERRDAHTKLVKRLRDELKRIRARPDSTAVYGDEALSWVLEDVLGVADFEPEDA